MLEGIKPATLRVPQIEVSFDLDANGSNIEAYASTVCKHITITNYKGRLTQDALKGWSKV